MDTATHERPRAAHHGLLSAAAVRRAWLALLVTLLVAALAGGLLRAGAGVGPDADWLGFAAVHHGALMVGAVMGALVGIERAVAVRRSFAWAAPVLALAGGASLLAGFADAGWLLAAAAAVFVAVNVHLLRVQAAPHMAVLLLGAVGWLVGNVLFALHAAPAAIIPWWFAFLLLTVTAERLEMTRLMRRRRGAAPMLAVVILLLVAGAAWSAIDAAAGGVAYGIALAGLCAWLLLNDIARRTIRAEGLPRYMAACLLAGHAWLGVAGLAWICTAAGLPARDAALHAIGLGFLASMVFGHAPVILPAVAGIKLQFGNGFYLPLALLHLSLAVRLVAGAGDAHWRAVGAAGNAVALATFAAVVAASAFTWKRRHAPRAPASTP